MYDAARQRSQDRMLIKRYIALTTYEVVDSIITSLQRTATKAVVSLRN